MTKNERAALRRVWIRMAKARGLTPKRGESLDSIKGRVMTHDRKRESFVPMRSSR